MNGKRSKQLRNSQESLAPLKTAVVRTFNACSPILQRRFLKHLGFTRKEIKGKEISRDKILAAVLAGSKSQKEVSGLAQLLEELIRKKFVRDDFIKKALLVGSMVVPWVPVKEGLSLLSNLI